MHRLKPLALLLLLLLPSSGVAGCAATPSAAAALGEALERLETAALADLSVRVPVPPAQRDGWRPPFHGSTPPAATLAGGAALRYGAVAAAGARARAALAAASRSRFTRAGAHAFTPAVYGNPPPISS
jgi:hypothetical protein